MTSLEAAAAHPDPSSSSEAKFGRVILQISNSVLPLEKLSQTPSSQDGMTSETEADLRNLGCNLIQTSGKLLKLPQVAMATGCVLFQRFFFSKSFVRYSMEVVAMGCVCLACKIEEAPRRQRQIHWNGIQEATGRHHDHELAWPSLLRAATMIIKNCLIYCFTCL